MYLKKSGGSISKDKDNIKADKRVRFQDAQAIYEALLDGSISRTVVQLRSKHLQQYTDKRKLMYAVALKYFDIHVLQEELKFITKGN